MHEGVGNYWKALTLTKPLCQDDLLPPNRHVFETDSYEMSMSLGIRVNNYGFAHLLSFSAVLWLI